MSLIETALQRVKAGSNTTKGERPGVPGRDPGAPAVGRREAAPVEAREPEVVIDESFLLERGLLASRDLEHQQRAEYRHIKYGLLREIRRASVGGLVLVTSALQGEGKSFTSFHLAMSLASEEDFSVVLADADVIRPSLTRMMGFEGRAGVMDVLADVSTDVESLILPTSIRGLSFLPAGRRDERATEHFSSTRMGEVTKQLLSVPNRLVVVDTLPMLLTTEARALTTLGGQIVLVVRSESTPQAAVREAIELLGEGANVKLLLNAAIRSKAMAYYGFGHGYDYYSSREESK